MLAALLLLGFSGFALYYVYVLHGDPLECGCFGGIIGSQLGLSTALRNLGQDRLVRDAVSQSVKRVLLKASVAPSVRLDRDTLVVSASLSSEMGGRLPASELRHAIERAL